MSEIRIVRDYPHPVAKVWRAVTDPALVPRWTATGAGGRPEGFAPVVGTKFRFIAKPKPGWRGVVDCEVLLVNEPSLLRWSWIGDKGGDVTEVTYRLKPRAGGTRFTYEHTGFTGVAGVFMAKLLGHVRRKMLTVGLPAVLVVSTTTARFAPHNAPLRITPRSARCARSRTGRRRRWSRLPRWPRPRTGSPPTWLRAASAPVTGCCYSRPTRRSG